jgi:hypothetical protein
MYIPFLSKVFFSSKTHSLQLNIKQIIKCPPSSTTKKEKTKEKEYFLKKILILNVKTKN